MEQILSSSVKNINTNEEITKTVAYLATESSNIVWYMVKISDLFVLTVPIKLENVQTSTLSSKENPFSIIFQWVEKIKFCLLFHDSV